MQKNNLKYFLSGVLSVSIWGFFSIPLRSLQAFDAEQILYYRIFISLIAIWIAIFLFRKQSFLADRAYFIALPKREKRTLTLQTIGSSILLTLNWFTFIYAVNNVSLTSAAFAYMVCPLITAFGGFIILKEKLSKLQLLSLGIALLSIGLLATGSVREVTWAIIIAVFYAFYLIIQRKIQHVDKLNVLAVQITISVIVMLPFYFSHPQMLPQSTYFWIMIPIIAVVFTIIPLFLSLYALIGLPSSTLGIIIYLNPIIAFTVAIVYFKTRIDPHQIFAYTLLLCSVLLFNWNLIKEIATFKTKK